MRLVHLLIASVVLALTAYKTASPSQTFFDPETTELVSTGLYIASAKCLTCHGQTTQSPGPREDAPALSTVLENYSDRALFDEFRLGIHLGHQDMPTFDFTVKETDAVLAFLKSIQQAPASVHSTQE